jgi:hypothetical protein
MAKKHESKWNIEDLTDREICDAIRYLEPGTRSTNVAPAPRSTNEEQDDVAALVISIIFVILMAGLGFILLYRW